MLVTLWSRQFFLFAFSACWLNVIVFYFLKALTWCQHSCVTILCVNTLQRIFNCLYKSTKNIPLYGISTLDTYSYHYQALPFPVLCCIDAKKDKFYAKITKENDTILAEGDYTFEEIANAIQNQKELLICGSDADKMSNLISEHFSDKIKCYTQDFDIITTNSLFNLAEKKIASNEDTLKDFEGPTYLRASEAEENLKA